MQDIRDDDKRRHGLQIHEDREGDATDYMFPGSRPADYNQHSMLGLMAVYNRLPAEVVEGCSCVSSFQKMLQELVKARALKHQCTDWKWTLSPRIPLFRHPLLSF